MSTSQIKGLLSPSDMQISQAQALEFLDANFPTFETLSSLESALRQAREQSEQLQSNLFQSQERVDSLVKQTRDSVQSRINSAQELSLLRHSLADELSYLSDELLSSLSEQEQQPTLLEDLEALHRKLKDVEGTKSYVQLIHHALKLSEEAVERVRMAPIPITKAALRNYVDLLTFLSKVKESTLQVEDASGHQNLGITSFIESVRDRTWVQIKNTLQEPLLAAAEKLGWPRPVDYTAALPSDRKAFEAAFDNLLQLQSLGAQINSSNSEQSVQEGIYPIQSLIQPIALRFKYHFEGARQTNRLDKPEWYMTHVLNVVHDHRNFMEIIIQRLLNQKPEYRNINSLHEFTYLLFPLLGRKLRRSVPQLLEQTALLAHTIYQALSFDSAITEGGFSLSGTSAKKTDENWAGISDIILGQKDWFEAWVEAERKFADEQYNDIISSPDAWLIANDDGVGEGFSTTDITPTNSGRKLVALVEQVTDRYSPLPQFNHRTRFLITVQLPLLEFYHSRISTSLDAFETLASSLARVVPGALTAGLTVTESGAQFDTRRLTSGTEGTQRLCKALLSARYVAAAMDAWGDDVFFLELWTEINRRASLRSRAEEHPSLPDPTKLDDSSIPEDTIFEELVMQYGKLINRAENIIVHQICAEVEIELKKHLNAPPRQVLEDESGLSQTLLPSISLLTSHLSYLRSFLPVATVTILYRRIASKIAEHIAQRSVLYRGRGQLSPKDGEVLLTEALLWVQSCQTALGVSTSKAEAPWTELLEVVKVVALQGEAWEKVENATFDERIQDAEWHNTLAETVGVIETSRDNISRALRAREDCEY